MSWAADEWKDGLPQKALAKINETEAHLERLKKERDQKQFQVESLEQALEVQKRKGGNEKSEIATLQRENKSLVETCKELEKKKEKLISDLSLKDSQVACLEKKVAEFSSNVLGKMAEPAQNQQEQMSDVQSEVIRSLQQELAELHQQLEDRCDTANTKCDTADTKCDVANTSARAGLGDEGGSTKPLRHMSEADELRKTQQELQTLRSLVLELEGKNKKLIQDRECTRHNTEAARLHLEVKMKETEKELKRELAQAMEAAKNAERVLLESKVKWQQELNAAHAEESKLKGLVEKLEAENVRLVREQEDLTKKLAAVEDVIKTSDAKVVEADKRKAALETEKHNLTLELEHKAREIQAQSAELLKLKNEIGQREQANDALKGQLKDRTLESETFKSEVDVASQKLMQAENQLMELQKLQQKTDDHVKEMSLSLNQLQKEKESLEGSNVELVKQLQKVQEEFQLVSTSLKDSQTQLDEVKCHFTESQNKWNDLEKTLRHELSQNFSSIAELSEQKVALENQLSAKDVEIVELANRCEASEKKVSSQDDELSQKSKDIGELEKQLQNVQDQLEGLMKEHHQQEMLAKEKATQLEMAVIEKTEELEMFVIQSAQDKTVLEAEAKKLLEEKQILEQEIHSCRFDCESGRVLIASLNEEIKTLKEVLESRDTSAAEMELVIQNKDKELYEMKEENVALSSGVGQRDQEIQFMKEKLVSIEKELEASQKELQTVGERCEALEAGNASFIYQIEECKRQDKCSEQVKEQLEKQVANLQDQLGSLLSECSALSEQVKGEQEKVILLEKNVDGLHNKCCELEINASVYAADLDSKSAVCEQLEGQCVQLSQFLESQKAENSDLSSKISSLETQLTECSKLHQLAVAELREQLQDAETHSNEYKSLLEQKDNLITELENEITRLKNGMSDLESVRLSQKVEIDEKSGLINSLEKSCTSLGDELEVLKLKVTEKEHQLCSQLENLQQMESKMGQLEEEKQALEVSGTEQLDLLQKELLQQTQELGQKDLRITHLEDQAQDLSNRLVGAQKEAEELDSKHAQEIGALKSKMDMLEMDVEDSDGQVKNLNGKVSDLSSLLEKLTQERDNLKETVQPLSEEVGELKTNLESAQACLAEVKQERDRLTEENGNFKTELDQMTSLIHHLEEMQASLSEELKESHVEMKEKEDILCSHLEILSQKENSITQLEEEKKALEITAEQLDTLQKEVVKHTQDLGQTASRITELEDHIQDLSSRLSEAQEEIVNLEEEKKALEITTEQLDTLQKEVVKHTQDLGQKASRITELEDLVQDLSSRLSEAQEEIVNLEEEKKALEITTEQLDTLQKEVDKHTQDLGQKASRITELEDLVQDLSSRLSEAREEIVNLVEEKKALEITAEQLDTLQKEVVKHTQDLGQKASRITELEDLVQDLSSSLSEARKEVLDVEAKYTHETGTLKSQLDLLQMGVEDSDGHVKELNGTVSNLTSLLEKATQERDRLRESLQQLSEEIEELSMNLESEQACLVEVKQERDRVAEESCHLKSTLVELQKELEGKHSLYEEKELCIMKFQKDNEEFVKKLHDCEAERDLLICSKNDLEQVLAVEKELVLAKTKEIVMLNENCSLLSQKLQTVTEQLSEQILEVSSRTQCLQAVECRLKELESCSVIHEERMQKEVAGLQLLVLQREESLAEVEKRREELDNVVEDLKCQLSQAEQLNSDGVLQHEQIIAVLQSKLGVLQMDVEDKNCVVQELNNKICDLERLIEKMAQDKEEICKSETGLQSDMLELKSALEVETQRAAQMKLNEDLLNDRITYLDSSLADARYELEGKEKDLQALQEEYDRLSARSDQQEKEFSDERDQLAAAKEDLQLCLDSEKLTAQSRTSDLEAATHRCGELSEQLEHVKGELSKLQTKLDCCLQTQQMMNCRVKDQEAELTKLQEASREDLEQLQQDLLEKQKLLEQRTSTINELEKKIVDMTSELCDVQREKAEADVCHEQEVARLNSHLEMLQMDYESEDCEVKELDTKVCSLQREIETAVNEKVKMVEVVETLESELLQLKSVLDMEREKATQAKLSEDTLKDRIKFLEADLSAVKFEKQAKEVCLQSVQLECETAKEMIVKQERVIKEYQIDQENANTMIKNGHEALDEQKLLVEAKTAELNVAHERYAAVLEELEMVRSEVMDKQNEIDARAQDIVQLENKINQLEREKASVRVELVTDFDEFHHSSDASDTTKEHSRELTEDSHDLNADTSRVEGVLSSLQEKCTEAVAESSSDHLLPEEQLAMPASTMDELHNEIEQKNQLMIELSDKNTDLETAMSLVNNEISKLQTTKALLESENSLLQEARETLKEETQQLMSEIQRLQADVAVSENLLSEKTASLESGKQGQIKLEQQLEEALANCEGLKLSLNQKTDQILHLETTIQDFESQLEVIRSEQSSLAKYPSPDVDAITLQLSSMKEDLQTRHTELEQLKTQYDDVNRALVKSNSKLAELQVEKATLSEQLENVEKLTKSYLQERDNTINILREELDSAAQENDALKTDKGEWQAREDRYKQDISDLEVKLADLNMEVVSTRESFESVSNQRFEAQGKLYSVLQEKKDLEGRLKELEVELDEAKGHVKSVQNLETTLENLKQDFVAKDEEIKCLKTQLNEMKKSGLGEFDSLQKPKKELEISLMEANERNRDLEEQLNEVTCVMNEMKEQLAQLQDLMQTLNSSVDSKRKEIIKRVNEISEKNDEISSLKALVEEKERMNNNISDQITNIQKEANCTVGTLQDAIESLNFELQAAEEEKNALVGKNEILKKESLELHKKINGLVNDNLQEACGSKEPSTQISQQDFHTLQDALESLNFELKAIEEEKEALVSENKLLKKESTQLHEKIKALTLDGETASNGEMNKQSSSAEKLVPDLSEYVHSLERENNDIKKQFEDKLKLAADLSLQVQLLNEQLQEKITLSENMAAQVESLTADVSLSVKRLSEKEAELCKSKEVEDYLNARVSEMSNQITSLQLDFDCKNDLLQKLKEENENILFKCRELEIVIVKLQDSIKKEVEAGEALKESLQTTDVAAADLSKYEQMIRDYNFAVIERDQLKERVQTLLHVEIDKQKLEEELKLELHKLGVLEKNVLEKQEELDRRSNLDEMLNAVELEKHSLRETVEKVELAKQMLGDKVKALGKEIEDLMQEKDLVESKVVKLEFDNYHLEDKVKELTTMVDDLANEKTSLQDEVMKLESCNFQLEDKLKEMGQKVDDLTIEKVSLQNEVERLESNSCQLEDKVKELDQLIEDSALEKVSLQDEIKMLKSSNYELEDKLNELNQVIEGSALETVSLQDEVKILKSSSSELEDKLKELNHITAAFSLEKVSLQDEVKNLKSRNCELEDKVKELDQMMADAALEKVSLQDEVNKLKSCNCELEDKMKELDQMIEDSALEKVSLQDEVNKLKSCNCELEDQVKELHQMIEDSALEKVSLQDEVNKLKSCNCELEDKLKELDKMMADAALAKVSLQDEVKKLKSSNCELEDKMKELDHMMVDAALEKVSLQDEVNKLKSSNCELEDKLKELDQMMADSALEKVSLQDEVKNLKSRNCELEDKVKELDQMMADSALEKVSLQDEVKKLKSSNCELEDKLKELDKMMADTALEKVSLQDEVNKLKSSSCYIENTMKELYQIIENAALEKVSLHDQIKQLESNNCNLESTLKELDQKVDSLTTEKVSLQNEIKKLESINCQLEDKLKQLNQKIEDLTFEKGSLQDKLQSLHSSNQQLDGQLKEMEKAASEYVQLQDKFEVQERHLAEKLKELSQSVAEKALLESQLKDLQTEHSSAPDAEGGNKSEQISGQHKELLRKWEHRCSELNNQLAMDRKKMQRLTEQVEKLKSAKEVDGAEEDSKFQTLKEELDEMKQERDLFQEKYMKISEAAERHFNKSKDLQRVNEKLNSRNKLLNALLKGEKPRVIVPVQMTASSLRFGAQNLHSEPGSAGSTEASRSVPGDSGGSSSGHASEHGLPRCDSQQVEPNVQWSQSVSGDIPASSHKDTARAHCMLEDNHKVGLQDKEKLISDADSARTDSLSVVNSTVTSHVREKLISDADAMESGGSERDHTVGSYLKEKLISDADTIKSGGSSEGDHTASSYLKDKLISADSQQALSVLEENKLNVAVKADSFKTETTKAHNISKVNNNMSCDAKEKPVSAEDSQNLTETNGHADSGTEVYSTRSSTRLKLRSPKGQGVQKTRISTPKSAIPTQLMQSTQKQKAEFISDVTSLSKMQTQTLKDSGLSSSTLQPTSLKIPESPSLKLKKHAFTDGGSFKTVSTPSKISSSNMPSKLFHTSTTTSAVSSSNMPSKLFHTSTTTSTVTSSNMPSKFFHATTSMSTVTSHNSPSKTSQPPTSTSTVSSHGNVLGQESNVKQSSEVTDELKPIPSPRVSRRMSLQKRRSVDQSTEAAGGKKSKMSLKEPIPETKTISGSRTSAQASRLPQPASTRIGQISGLPRPMRTRSSRQETLPSQNALATITNSPRKTPSQESKVRRTSRATARTTRTQAADEGASECKIN